MQKSSIWRSNYQLGQFFFLVSHGKEKVCFVMHGSLRIMSTLDTWIECKPIVDLDIIRTSSQLDDNMQTNRRKDISSFEKMISACTGALVTSLLGILLLVALFLLLLL